jgi:hypothetical protein
MMEWVKGFVVNTFFLNERQHRDESPDVSPRKVEHVEMKKRDAPSPQEEETRTSPSLNGRSTPADLVGKASFRIKHIKDAQYTLHNNNEVLIVNLPKRKRKNVRKNYVMPYYKDLETLCGQIQEDMEYDGFRTMTSFQLAAEYPFYFWNGMFHCLGNLETLESKMRENGIETKAKRRR